MEKLIQKIKEKKIKRYVIILDNYSSHKTEDLMKFYSENKVNILFNTPYLLKFNSVELAFRNLKRNLYTKCFKNINEIKNQVELILKSENFKNGIRGNYAQTLKEYLSFHEREKDLNINILYE